MLTRIVNSNEYHYIVGELFNFEGKNYVIHEIEVSGDLTRL